jgi:hypothetical protein
MFSEKIIAKFLAKPERGKSNGINQEFCVVGARW